MVLERLSKIPIFANVPRSALEDLITHCAPIRYPPKKVVFSQGDAANYAVLLIEGKMAVSIETKGRPRQIDDIRSGELVGEAGLFIAGGRRSATITTTMPSTCLTLTPAIFRSASDNPAVIALEMYLIKENLRRIRGTHREVHKIWRTLQDPNEVDERSSPTLLERLQGLLRGWK